MDAFTFAWATEELPPERPVAVEKPADAKPKRQRGKKAAKAKREGKTT